MRHALRCKIATSVRLASPNPAFPVTDGVVAVTRPPTTEVVGEGEDPLVVPEVIPSSGSCSGAVRNRLFRVAFFSTL
eukprot:TRINITY_DN8371_c0_g1_i1.p4 TRINITY_DN8371_c0_g1~~TRINITY_DN8371_c0_g1_i1.p4  ORF type:complete len:77 (+),score=4.76 TRINITY_DN8371_c0_g1_i1:137-367(+)